MFPNVQILLNFQIFILIFDNIDREEYYVNTTYFSKQIFPTEYYKRPSSTLKCIPQFKFEWNLRTLNLNIIFLSNSVKYKNKLKIY